MKRGWIGLILLLVLLVGGILSAGYLTEYQKPLAAEMDRAGDLALLQEMEQASRIAREVRAQWQRRWKITAVFSDHQPMEQIDALFAQLEKYEAEDDPRGYALVCCQLASELMAMADGNIPSWWNLL